MNYKVNVLLFNIFFLFILIIASFIFYKLPANIKPIDIFSDIKKNNLAKQNIAIVHTTIAAKKGVTIKDYTTYKGLINSSGNNVALYNFFAKLSALQKHKIKKVRIAYFGDSMIEGDLITQDLRKQLQDSFGGNGVGFVPITSIVAGFRQTIIHSFSGNWDDVNFKSDNKGDANLFISGHSFFANNSWVNYRAVNQPHLNYFTNVSILYGLPAGGQNTNASILINGKSESLSATSLVNSLNIKYNNSNEIKLDVGATSIPFYGVAFESDSGVVVDNFSFRGISGVELNYFSNEFIEQIQKTRPYDLVIFHYGPNLLFKPNLTDFSWYQKKMQPILQRLKTAFAGASVLIISTADKGFNYDGNWHTAKGVVPLINTQYDMAQNTGADFFNLYNAMGGEDAIVNWVQGDTAYANRDYTHVNFRGAKRLASIIFKVFENEFNDFTKSSN